jgi:hypothetical protein
MKRFSRGSHYIQYSTDRMELAAEMFHNRVAFREANLQRCLQVSGSLSSIQKSSVPSWVDAGVWVDIVLIGMVVGSVAGLAYIFLAQ